MTPTATPMFSVLLVDDDEKILDIFSQFLESKGCRVHVATGGHEAVQAVREHPVDLVMMDVRMPDLDGLEAFRQIRQAAPTVPVVLMTGYSAREDLQQLIQAGEVEYLHKPVALDQLSKLVDRLASQRHSQ